MHNNNPVGLTIKQLANELDKHYQRYAKSSPYKTYINLESRKSQKARNKGYLDLQDLLEITEWGGNQHGIKNRLITGNSPENMRQIRMMQDFEAKALEAFIEACELGIS